MNRKEILLEAWNIIEKSCDKKLSEEEDKKLHKHLFVLTGDDALYKTLKHNNELVQVIYPH